mgnify:CR=1 FL=1
MIGKHKYYFMAMYFVEIDLSVDIYGHAPSMYNCIEYYTPIPMGPYSDTIIIEAKTKLNLSYVALITVAEVLYIQNRL